MNRLGELLDSSVSFIRRYVVLRSTAQAVALALWVAHTHCLEAADSTPYVAITSPEKRSGKSLLLEVLELVVRNPLRTSSTSTAALFREIAATSPTLLFDEVDAAFGRKRDGATEDLRGILNAGHRRGATVLRVVGEGKKMHTERFPVFGAKAFAAIGTLPDTIADRSIPIRLQRKASGETVERFRYRHAQADGADLGHAMSEALESMTQALSDARPDIPAALDDRSADGWEPLLSLAGFAGGEWPERARGAALELCGDATGAEESIGVLLLGHIAETMNGHDRMSTEDLLGALIERDDGPWAGWWARDVEDGKTRGPASRLARLLRPFGIESSKMRVDDRSVRGYLRESFEPAWERYLTAVPPRTAKRMEQRNSAGQSANESTTEQNGTTEQGRSEACSVVPSRNGSKGERGLSSVPSTDLFADWSFDGNPELCIVCGQLCVPRDPEGRVRHPACALEVSA